MVSPTGSLALRSQIISKRILLRIQLLIGSCSYPISHTSLSKLDLSLFTVHTIRSRASTLISYLSKSPQLINDLVFPKMPKLEVYRYQGENTANEGKD